MREATREVREAARERGRLPGKAREATREVREAARGRAREAARESEGCCQGK